MTDHPRPEREIDTRPIRRLELIPRGGETTAEEDRFEAILWDPESPVWRISAPEEEVEELPDLVGSAAPANGSTAPERVRRPASAPAQDPAGGEGPLFALGGLALVVVSVLLVVVVSFRGGTASPTSPRVAAPAALSTVAMPSEPAARPAPAAPQPPEAQSVSRPQPAAGEKAPAVAGKVSPQRASVLPVPAYPLAAARLKGEARSTSTSDGTGIAGASAPAPVVASRPAPAPKAVATAGRPRPTTTPSRHPQVAVAQAPVLGPVNRPDVVVTALQPSRPTPARASRPPALVAQGAPRPAAPADARPRPARPPERGPQARPPAPARPSFTESLLAATGRTLRNPWLLVAPPRGEH